MAYITSNSSLRTIKHGWSGNPLDNDGKYCNIDGPSARGYTEVFKWKLLQTNAYKEEKNNQYCNVEVQSGSEFLTEADTITWLGHASFVFNLGGKRMITDPVFYNLGPIKRYPEMPCDPDLIRDLDYILLSHAHRDHLDKESMLLVCKNNPQAVILTGLQVGNIIKKWNVENEIIEAGWFQRYLESDELKIDYVPAKHWNRRWLTDLNTVLWGGFMIDVGGRKLYFGGDSGLGEHFGEIKELYQEIDTAILGIGAYEPVWFMQASHTSPSDVASVSQLLKPRRLIPMHYGTYDLSDEPLHNPKESLQELVKEGKVNGQIEFMSIGKAMPY